MKETNKRTIPTKRWIKESPLPLADLATGFDLDQDLALDLSLLSDQSVRDMDHDMLTEGDMVISPSEPIDDTEEYVRLHIDEANIEGSYSSLLEGQLLLDAEATVTWLLEPNTVPRGSIISLFVKGQTWRFEDGAVNIRVNEQIQQARIWGDGRNQYHPIRHLYEAWPLDLSSFEGLDEEALESELLSPLGLSLLLLSYIHPRRAAEYTLNDCRNR